MRLLVTSIVDVERAPNTRLHHFLAGLCDDHEITVVCPRDAWRARQTDVARYGSGSRRLRERTATYHLAERDLSPVAQEVSAEVLLRRLPLAFDSFDAHLDYSSLLLGAAARRRVHAAGGGVVYDVADDLVAMVRESPQLPRPLGRVGGALAGVAFRRNVARADCVTYISEVLADQIRGARAARRIPNGVDASRFRPDVPTDGVERPPTEFVVGYVGTNREWVDLGRVVDAVALLRGRGYDAGLLVVGEEGGLDGVRARAERRGVADVCAFPGTILYVQVPAALNAMDAGTIPFAAGAIADGSLPLKLLEYLACEVPVVSAPLAGVRGAVGDGVLYAETPREFADALERLLIAPGEARAMGEAGRALVEREYTWDRQVERLSECLDAVAARRA